MKLLLIKTKTGIDIPLNTMLTIDGKTVEVLGLAKTEEKDGFILQYYVVHEEGENIADGS